MRINRTTRRSDIDIDSYGGWRIRERMEEGLSPWG